MPQLPQRNIHCENRTQTYVRCYAIQFVRRENSQNYIMHGWSRRVGDNVYMMDVSRWIHNTARNGSISYTHCARRDKQNNTRHIG